MSSSSPTPAVRSALMPLTQKYRSAAARESCGDQSPHDESAQRTCASAQVFPRPPIDIFERFLAVRIPTVLYRTSRQSLARRMPRVNLGAPNATPRKEATFNKQSPPAKVTRASPNRAGETRAGGLKSTPKRDEAAGTCWDMCCALTVLPSPTISPTMLCGSGRGEPGTLFAISRACCSTSICWPRCVPRANFLVRLFVVVCPPCFSSAPVSLFGARSRR